MRVNKTFAAGLTAALVGSTLSVVGLAGSAQAASMSTATIAGAPTNLFGLVWYDDAPAVRPPAPTNPAATVDLTATSNAAGTAVDVEVDLSRGPYNSIVGITANKYRLDAFVTLDDGVTSTPHRLIGTVGTVDVPALTTTYASGVTISGSITGLTPGDYTVTLTDLLLDSVGDVSGACPAGNTFGTLANGSDATCFDSWYNLGANGAAVIARTAPIALEEDVTVAPSAEAFATVATSTAQAAGAQYIARNSALFARELTLTGENFNASDSGGTVALCDANGTSNCSSTGLSNALVTDVAGDLTGDIDVAQSTVLATGARALVITGLSDDPVVVPVTVLTSPTMSINPPTGPLGTFTVTGTNWNTGGAGKLFGSTGTTSQTASDNTTDGTVDFTASATGTISASYTVTDPLTKSIGGQQGYPIAGPPNAVQASGFVAFADNVAPTGTAVVAPTTGNVGVSSTVTISNVADNVSAPAAIVATVNWGDGTAPQALAAGVTTASHVFAKAGAFPVTVTLKDAAANTSAPIAAGTVTVTAAVVTPPADTTAPVVKVTKPKNPTKGSSWKSVKGSVTDAGGAATVEVKLVSKTSDGWQYFNGKKWKDAKNKKDAQKKAKAVTDKSVSSGSWSIKAKKAPKGKLTVTYTATDKAGNKSATKSLSQKISK